MNRLMFLMLFSLSLILGSLSLGGCNTFSGMGADTRESLNALQVGPHEAYHQEARDF